MDPQIDSLATYLAEWLNSAVVGEQLVGEAIAVDAFVAYLETDANFPLLQVSRGDGRGRESVDTQSINIEYIMPSGLDLLLSRPGWLNVVSEEIQAALKGLRYRPVLGQCCEIKTIAIAPRFLAFIDQTFPILSVQIEITGCGHG